MVKPKNTSQMIVLIARSIDAMLAKCAPMAKDGSSETTKCGTPGCIILTHARQQSPSLSAEGHAQIVLFFQHNKEPFTVVVLEGVPGIGLFDAFCP